MESNEIKAVPETTDTKPPVKSDLDELSEESARISAAMQLDIEKPGAKAIYVVTKEYLAKLASAPPPIHHYEVSAGELFLYGKLPASELALLEKRRWPVRIMIFIRWFNGGDKWLEKNRHLVRLDRGSVMIDLPYTGKYAITAVIMPDWPPDRFDQYLEVRYYNHLWSEFREFDLEQEEADFRKAAQHTFLAHLPMATLLVNVEEEVDGSKESRPLETDTEGGEEKYPLEHLRDLFSSGLTKVKQRINEFFKDK